MVTASRAAAHRRPLSLSHRTRNKAYAKSADLVRALVQVLKAEAWALADAGARLLQIDEPFLAGYPEDVAVAVEANQHRD